MEENVLFIAVAVFFSIVALIRAIVAHRGIDGMKPEDDDYDYFYYDDKDDYL